MDTGGLQHTVWEGCDELIGSRLSKRDLSHLHSALHSKINKSCCCWVPSRPHTHTHTLADVCVHPSIFFRHPQGNLSHHHSGRTARGNGGEWRGRDIRGRMKEQWFKSLILPWRAINNINHITLLLPGLLWSNCGTSQYRERARGVGGKRGGTWPGFSYSTENLLLPWQSRF